MSIQKVPSKIGGDNKMRLTDYELMANAINSKGCEKVFPLLDATVGTGDTITHNFGTLLGLTNSQYHLKPIFVEDIYGWPITGIRVEQTTLDVATVIFSDSITLPFTGKITLKAVLV